MTNPFPTRSSSDLFEEAPAPAVAPPRIAREAVRVVLDHDKPAGGLAGPADSSRGQIVGRSLVELLHQDGAVGKMARAEVGLDAFRLRVDDVEFSRALLAQDRASTEIGPDLTVNSTEKPSVGEDCRGQWSHRVQPVNVTKKHKQQRQE